ncbi:hypothetical protein [Catenovulum maritimum]|uniref:Uncharacterized protein n=1 Tax=Catenovulum maritimum TaxID=1513271 RepID=A0A0J8GLP2_9ALTE|nr:hypothetical protein [Catenovulum maritimum]KMT63730.1 hypothetical protein XM47_18080 [Catenovulum maritimum]
MNWISYILILVLFVISVRIEKKLLNHVKNTYPSEWETMNVTKMGVKAYSILPSLIGNSLKTGFLSQQDDDVLVKLHKLNNFSWLISFIFLLVTIVFFVS